MNQKLLIIWIFKFHSIFKPTRLYLNNDRVNYIVKFN